MKTKIFLNIVFCCLLAVGCKENDIVLNFDDKSDNRKIEFAGPLARVNITAIDWLKDGFPNEEFMVDMDGLIHLAYTQEVFLEWETLVEIGNKNDEFIFSTVKVDGALQYPQKIKFNNANDVRLDRLNLAEGELQYTVEAPAGTNGTITIAIPELKTGTIAYSRILTVTPSQRIFNINEILSGKSIEFSQETNSSYITFNTTIDLNPVNAGDTPGPARIAYSINNIVPEVAFGYFGQRETKRTNASMSVSFFNELELVNEFEFADLELSVITYNKIGVPFFVRTDNIRLFKEEDPDNKDHLEINGTDYTEINTPAGVYGNPILPGINKYNINGANSNIVPIINKYPDKLWCDITAWSNPDGDVAQNFMTNETRLQTDLVLKVPFFFRSELYERNDTIKFDFNDMVGDDPDDVEKIELFEMYFDFFNKFPMEMVANARVVNEADETIEILLSNNQQIIKSGIPGANGRINKAEHTTMVVNVTNQQIKRFISEKARNIILETKASSFNSGQPFIKIFDDSEMNVNISIKVKTQLP